MHLPPEILLAIFECGRPQQVRDRGFHSGIGTRRDYYFSLRMFSLVHRTWTPWAQELLFAHIEPPETSPSGCYPIDALLDAPEYLRSRTKSLSLRLGDHLRFRRPSVVLARYAPWLHLPRILRAFPNLNSLRLDLYSLHSCGPLTEELHEQRSLRHLVVRACAPGRYNHWNILYRRTCSWPLLETLEVFGFSTEPCYSARAIGPVHSVEELRAPRWCSQIEWVRNTVVLESKHLRALRCSIWDLPLFLPYLHVSLETLTVDVDANRIVRAEDDALACLALCRRLEKLVIVDPSMAPANYVKGLPAGLRHISIAVHPGWFLNCAPEIDWYSLRTITLVWPPQSYAVRRYLDLKGAKKDAAALRAVCSKHRVELTMLSDSYPEDWRH